MDENIQKLKKEIEKFDLSFYSNEKEKNSTIDSSLIQCPACRERQLREADPKTMACLHCGSQFVRSKDKYIFISIKDTDNPFWIRYHHKIFTFHEWNKISEKFVFKDEKIDSTDAKEKAVESGQFFVQCPACREPCLIKTTHNILACSYCGSKFLEQNGQYKYIFIKNIENPLWLKYANEIFLPHQWSELSDQFSTEIEKWNNKNKISREFSNIITEVHPWRRYFARIFDFMIVMPLWLIILVLFSPKTPLVFTMFNLNEFWFGVISIFIYVVLVEPVMFSAFGTTPGKALLKISVVNHDGDKISYETAMKRNLQLWIKGLGIGLPIITFFTLLISYNKLNNFGTTDWDDKYKIRILYGEVGFFRYLLFGVIFFVINMFYSAILMF